MEISKLDIITRQIRDQGMTYDLRKVETSALKELEEWELREEIFWKQKSRLVLIGYRKGIGTLLSFTTQ